MHPLNVYGYHVRFGHSEHKQEDYRIQESVCFSALFGGCKSRDYRVFILKGDGDLKKYHSNYCFFDRKQIINHLKQIPNFCNMKFSVIDSEYKGDPAYQIDFFIDSDNRLIHKYVLTWLRTLFEWPFYLYLVHAKELRKRPEFKFDSVINLFNIVATCYKADFHDKIHTFGTQLLPLRKVDIANRVNEKPRGYVNNVFPAGNVDVPQCKLPTYFEDITPELFEKCLPAYIEAYHIIKNYEAGNNRN